MRALAGVLAVLAQAPAPKPWIWTEATPTPPKVPAFPSSGRGFGGRIAVLRDLDHDGVADLAISALLESGFGCGWGCVYVVSGLDGHLIRRIPNPDSSDYFGSSLHVCADVDQDGLEYLIVGSSADWTCVVSSRSGRLVRRFWGRSVAVAADLDGDGIPEFITGVEVDSGSGRDDTRGLVTAVSGCDDRELFRVCGHPAWPSGPCSFAPDGFGGSLCVLGDLDGDGVPDIAAGVPRFRAGEDPVGAVRFLSGKTGATFRTLVGPFAPGAYSVGAGLVPAGDLDGDGYEDLLAASDNDYPVFAISGRTGEILLTFRHKLSDGYLDGFGDSIAPAGDLDGDGKLDFAVGSSEYLRDEGDRYSVELFSGADGHWIRGFESDRRHAVVGEARDFDRDGIPDLPIGLPELGEVVILSGAGIRSSAAGAVLSRSEWPVLRTIRRDQLER